MIKDIFQSLVCSLPPIGLPMDCATKRWNTKSWITKRQNTKRQNTKRQNTKRRITKRRITQPWKLQNIESYRTSKYRTSNSYGRRTIEGLVWPMGPNSTFDHPPPPLNCTIFFYLFRLLFKGWLLKGQTHFCSQRICA